jgi:hypothetical protein
MVFDHHDVTEILLKVVLVLLVEETGGPVKNHQPVSQVTDKLYHINDDDRFISEKSKAKYI